MFTKYPAKIYLLCIFFITIFSYSGFAQVGIGNTNPNSDSLLEVGDGTDTGGVLLPRVSLTATNSPSPLSVDVAGMIVYNTNTNGSGTTAVSPGFYFNDGTDWVRITNKGDWKLTGNAGTTAGTNFLGTTDNTNLLFKTNNTDALTIDNTQKLLAVDGSKSRPTYSFSTDTNTGIWRSGGDKLNLGAGNVEFIELSEGSSDEIIFNQPSNDINFRVVTDNDANTVFVDGANDNIGMGTNTPATDVKLEVNGGSNNGIYGYSNNVGGYLGRETNITIGVAPNTQTMLGAGVYANNPFAGYTSIFSQSTGAATVAANINYSDVWIANYNYVDNARSSYNPSAVYSQLNNTAGVVAYRASIFGYSNSGTTASSGGIDVGVRAQSAAQNDNTLGMMGISFSDTGDDNSGAYFATVGYTSGTVLSETWVANSYLGTDYKVFGSGTVSTIVQGENDKHIMYAPEAPEVLFQDFGVGQLVNGTTTINIDPILAKNIVVDANHPLKVYVTLEGECNGVYVTNKSLTGFTVKELQHGTSNVSFSWQIVANRKDRKGDDKFGDSKFQDLRFPVFNKDYMPKIKKEENTISQSK